MPPAVSLREVLTDCATHPNPRLFWLTCCGVPPLAQVIDLTHVADRHAEVGFRPLRNSGAWRQTVDFAYRVAVDGADLG